MWKTVSLEDLTGSNMRDGLGVNSYSELTSRMARGQEKIVVDHVRKKRMNERHVSKIKLSRVWKGSKKNK